MAACLAVALMRALLTPVSKVTRTVFGVAIGGVAIGAAITSEVIHDLPRMAGSPTFVPLYIAVRPSARPC